MELSIIDDTKMEMKRLDHCNTAILMAQKICISVYQKSILIVIQKQKFERLNTGLKTSV